jgi:hypothetical protein
VRSSFNVLLEEYVMGFVSKFSILGELWEFLRVRKKWWLTPIVIMLVMLGLLIVLTEGSAVAPFIYALF